MSYLISITGSLLKTADSLSIPGSYIASSDTTFLTLGVVTSTGVVGTAYSSTPSSTGTAPKAFTLVSGALPNGLALNATTGAIIGTPTLAGLFIFDIQLIDNVGATQITTMSILITSAPVVGSGLYKLIPNQKHDELYTIAPTTVNVKISWFIETYLAGDE